MRAVPLLTSLGYSVADTGYWRVAIVILAAAFLAMLFLAQSGEGAKLEKGAEVAFGRARQLLHEADKENRSVRPLPLSLATVGHLSEQESAAGKSAGAVSMRQRASAAIEITDGALAEPVSLEPAIRALLWR